MFLILIITYITCLDLDYSQANTEINQISKPLEVALTQFDFKVNSIYGVQLLKTQLQDLGNGDRATDGKSGTEKKQSRGYGFAGWLLVAIAILGSTGALLYLIKRLGNVKKEEPASESSTQQHTNAITPSPQESDQIPTENQLTDSSNNQTPTTDTPQLSLMLPESTSRLSKVDIVDELIKDLGCSDPIKRRQAIWDLGQKGDSRAIQPLVDLMIDADSQQRSLILAALAEISTRTLKPMNRALAMSLQDESPQVRQNAIRDLTRVYDMMAQISQMLCHAVQDQDTEVQATARYALTQMNRIRSLSASDSSSGSLSPAKTNSKTTP